VAWSPDGKKIASSDREFKWMNCNGVTKFLGHTGQLDQGVVDVVIHCCTAKNLGRLCQD